MFGVHKMLCIVAFANMRTDRGEELVCYFVPFTDEMFGAILHEIMQSFKDVHVILAALMGAVRIGLISLNHLSLMTETY